MFYSSNHQESIISKTLAYVQGPEAWYLLLILKKNLKEIETLTQTQYKCTKEIVFLKIRLGNF